MLRQIPKVLLLVALLAAFAASSIPAFGTRTCTCFAAELKIKGGCHSDKVTGLCINTGCRGTCQ